MRSASLVLCLLLLHLLVSGTPLRGAEAGSGSAGSAGSPGPEGAAAAPAVARHPSWQPWSDDLWTRAQADHRLVLLEVGARWCHWCQVMDRTTYRDAAVLDALEGHFIAVHVDQAERPDIANRYEDYGWPATIIFAADGAELVRRRGYLPPEEMRGLLAAVVADPAPGPSVRALAPVAPAGTSARLGEDLRAQLRRAFAAAYDQRLGGWGRADKELDGACILAAWRAADAGDDGAAAMAATTMGAARALIDPVWGGVCQYSVDDWRHLHFEKLAQVQAEAMRTYALAQVRGDVPGAGMEARRILGFIRAFLAAPDGGFYASQDADVVPGVESSVYYALDDAARRARVLPGIDRHRFAREQGWLAEALATAGACLGDASAVAQAEAAARWAMAERALPGGGFRHDASDAAGPYLGDTLAMGQAFLRLYQVTGEERWLALAEQARRFIDSAFQDPTGGYRTAAASGLPVGPERDENTALARWARQLWAATGLDADRACAERAACWCFVPPRAMEPSVAGVLLADEDPAQPRARVLVVGPVSDPATQSLVAQALAFAAERDAVVRWDGRAADAPALAHLPATLAPGLYRATADRWDGPSASCSHEQARPRVQAAP